MTKTRIEVNVPHETKTVVNQIVGVELEKDRAADRPERSRNAILEMLLNKGIHAWHREANSPGLPPNRSKGPNSLPRTSKSR